MGIFFWYENMSIFASRGSFTSSQAQAGAEMMYSKYKYEELAREYTWICEIVYPENRIVVDYGEDRKLVLITAINTKTGKEMSYEELLKFSIFSCHELMIRCWLEVVT